MRTEAALALVLVLVLALVCSGCVVMPDANDGGMETFSDAGVPCVTMPPNLDFGEVELGLKRTISVRLFNRANQAVQLSFSEINAPFASTVTLSPLKVDALASQNVQFSFIAPDGRLHFSELTFTGGKGCVPQTVRLSGLGAGGLDTPAVLQFPAIESGTSTTVMLRIFNTRREPNRVFLNVNPSSDGLFHFSAPQFVDVAPAATIDAPITFTASGDGMVLGSLMLGSDHRDRADVILQGMSGVPVIELSRRRIESDPLGLELSSQRMLQLRNAGQGELLISRVSVTSPQPGAAAEVTVNAVDRLRPGLVSDVTLRLSPRSIGHREWTVHFESNDPVTPSFDVELVAEVSELPGCELPISAPPELMVWAPYPRELEVTFENTRTAPCVVESLAFTDFTRWMLDLGAQDSFVVPPQSIVRRTVTITEPGQTMLEFMSYSLGPGRTLITAQP